MATIYRDLTHTADEVDQTVDQFAAHTSDTVAHVTILDREKWDGKADADASYSKSEADTLLASKVDKVSGKQLSTEDYSTAEKQKLSGLSNYNDTELRGLISGKADSADLADEIDARSEADTELQTSLGAVANAGAKNIVNNTAATTVTQSGITWTRNADGSMSASGTSTGVSAVRVVGVQGSSTYASAVPIPKGKYIISASGFSLTRYRVVIGLFADENSARQTTNIYNEEMTIEVTTDTARYDLSCVIAQSGEVMTGETWHPMIRPADIPDDTFVPYAPTNRELYEMIADLQARVSALESAN